MLKKEIIQEIFVEAPHRDSSGNISPAPAVAQFMLEGFKRSWHDQDVGPGRTTMVSMGPSVKDGVEGYSVRGEIVYIR